jgi:hypothetical protein
MAFARTILALVTALAVAFLPAVGGAAVNAKTYHANEMTAAGSMDDCCPHATNRCDNAAHECGSMATCALHCFSFTGGQSSPLGYPRRVGHLVPTFESVDFYTHTGNPPFRPPRA